MSFQTLKKHPDTFCVVHWYNPYRGIENDKVIFQFERKSCWNRQEMKNYIFWFFKKQNMLLYIEDILFDTPIETCRKIRDLGGGFIDWNTCNRSWFNTVKKDPVFDQIVAGDVPLLKSDG
tara:strand:- start:130 stop:489 length:360 start_codon:yes stop_codon:yes gene_type:complete